MPPGGFELFGSSSNCGSCIEGWQFEFEFGFECDYEIGRSCNRTWRGGSSSLSLSSSATTRSEGLATRSGGAVRVRVRVQVEVTSGTAYVFSRGGRGAVRVRGRVRGRTAVRALLPERGGCSSSWSSSSNGGAVRVRVRPTPTPFFSYASFIWLHLIFIDIYRNLCLCTSFLERIAG